MEEKNEAKRLKVKLLVSTKEKMLSESEFSFHDCWEIKCTTNLVT